MWKILLILVGGLCPTTVALKLQQGDTACRTVTFIPFTDARPGLDEEQANEGSYGYGSWPSAGVLGKAAFSLMASAEIARKHFNDRNTDIVKELANLTNCPIRIPNNSLYVDSEFSRDKTVDAFLKREFEDISLGINAATQVCGIIGPVVTTAHEGLAALTENFDIPQVAYNSIQNRLSRTDLFSRFLRVIPEATDWGGTLAKAVQRDLWLREYLAIIYEPDYGNDFESPLEDAEKELDNFLTITEEVREGDQESIKDAVAEVIKEGYRTIMYIGDRFELLDDIARVADSMGLVGEGYFWILSGAAVQPSMLSSVKAEAGSSLDKLLDGAAVFTNFDPFVYNSTDDVFLQAWRSQAPQMVEHLKFKSPKPEGDDAAVSDSSFYNAEPDYFQTETPTEYASFIYDAVIATGIGACQAYASGGNVEGDHYDSIMKSTFTGASGVVKFKRDDDGELENSRDMSTLKFGMHNIRPSETDASGMRGYESVLYALWSEDNKYINAQGEAESGAWQVVDGAEFYFYGQTTTEPGPIRTVFNANYIPRTTQRIGFAAVGLSCIISLLSAAWVFVNRKERIVTAGQPPFLYLLCLGSILVAISLIFISFDEGKGWSKSQLDRGCSLFPWFFMFGYLTIYCALLCKLWRLSKLMQFRRKTVSMYQVLAPFGVIMLCTLFVLLIWQIKDPFIWDRKTINYDPLETIGECQVEGNLLAYLLPLGFLIVIVTFGTAFYAWKLKDVQSDLSESKMIFFGIFSHLQTWIVGIPIVVITGESSKEAEYMMMVALTFIFSTTMVGFVIWPKIFEWFSEKYGKGQTKATVIISTTRQQSRISGLQTSSGNNNSVNVGRKSSTTDNSAQQRESHDQQSLQEEEAEGPETFQQEVDNTV